MIRKIFYNDLQGNIRAGWRMGIFLILFFIMNGAVGPVIRYLQAQFRLFPATLVFSGVAYGVLLLATWIILRLLEKRPLSSVGLANHGRIWLELAQGVVVGGGMMTAIFLTEYAFGMVQVQVKEISLAEIAQSASISMAVFVVGAFGEELMFRGYLFQTMIEGAGKIISVGAFALFFALVHATNPHVTIFSLANIAVAGIWLSLAYLKTRTLWFPIALHFSWNFFQNFVFVLPVSGFQFSDYQYGILTQSGPQWITGGSFGPEGGALATVSLIVGIIVIERSSWIRMSEDVWTIEKWSLAKIGHSVETHG